MNTIFLANVGAFVTAYAQSDLLGKLIILGLISLSILCWVVMVQKIWTARQVDAVSKAFHKAFLLNKERFLHLELEELPKPKNKFIPHPFAEIFRELKGKTVEILNKNHYFISRQGGKRRAGLPYARGPRHCRELRLNNDLFADKKTRKEPLYPLHYHHARTLFRITRHRLGHSRRVLRTWRRRVGRIQCRSPWRTINCSLNHCPRLDHRDPCARRL